MDFHLTHKPIIPCLCLVRPKKTKDLLATSAFHPTKTANANANHLQNSKNDKQQKEFFLLALPTIISLMESLNKTLGFAFADCFSTSISFSFASNSSTRSIAAFFSSHLSQDYFPCSSFYH
jgi:hypothetical protein